MIPGEFSFNVKGGRCEACSGDGVMKIEMNFLPDVFVECEECKGGKTVYILDEPTTGLHFHDVKKLIGVLERLVDAGNTVIVIEHNLDVIKCADYIIDLGPEGGTAGGTIIAKGTPEEVSKVKKSYTVSHNNFPQDKSVYMGKLRDRDMRNIIRNRKQKKKSVAWLAEYYGVTKRRIRQILAYEEKYGAAPIVHNKGRKMKKITEKEEELIVSYYLLTRLSPVYLERVIEKKEVPILENKSNGNIIDMNEITPCHYGMEIGNRYISRIKTIWMIIAFVDDSSRLITCSGLYENATAANTIDTLKKGFEEYGIPDAILIDNGTQFFCCEFQLP
ncbi:unnamed protein product [Cylicocyclus nassatus]|uniref:Integrase catalytic domain-containing protein n=1 Tax=Cylicocyclus nassatus TaxID=53992 RepID=A0AA36GYZ5_CYLNA|nr:unnamed protein product [Cylicocyclus nassatus]